MSILLDIAPSVFIDKFVSKINEDYSKELERVKVRQFIVKNFDMDALRNSGFIDSVNDFDQAEKKILSFFGLNSVFEYKSNVEVPVSI